MKHEVLVLPPPDDFSEQATATRVALFLQEYDDLMRKYAVVLVWYFGADRLQFERVDSRGDVDHALKCRVEDAYAQFGELLPPDMIRFATQEGI